MRGSFFLYFVCCTLDYFILPVRQADVAFLTLFIGISGGKAWFISFGTNYLCSLIPSPLYVCHIERVI